MNPAPGPSDPRNEASPGSPVPGAWPGLIDELLATQQAPTLGTAVARFARKHDAGETPTQARYYRDLVPLSKPGAGEQYAFEVDLDQCSGCKACVTACHALNGLEDDESWRSVGLLVGKVAPTKSVPIAFRHQGSGIRHPASDEAIPDTRSRMWTPALPVQRTVTTACHHCVDPACLNGCPVLAYEKDPVTGIVRHLDDQCIGCQYCVMKCPYEVPQYSKRLGVVRKCDMCSQRLAGGEAPACVQACPNEAIRISVVDVRETIIQFRPPAKSANPGHKGANDAGGRIDQAGQASSLALPQPTDRLQENGASWKPAPPSNPFLPASPHPGITVPTTRYTSSLLESATLRAADEASVQPSDPHVPLALMLPLSQLSVGLLIGAAYAGSQAMLKLGATAAFVVMATALGIATLHLGQPLRAWKAFLGWRRSWFSREAIAFGGYVKSVGALAAVLWFKPEWLSSGIRDQASGIGHLASGTTAFLGLVSIFCSVMLYADTRREFWSFSRTGWKFGGSTVLLGLAATNALLAFAQTPRLAWWLVPAVAVLKLLGEIGAFTHLGARGYPPLKKSALLIVGPLRAFAWVRLMALLLGGVALPLVLSLGFTMAPLPWCVLSLGLLLVGEVCERLLFFAAVAPDKMPGGVVA